MRSEPQDIARQILVQAPAGPAVPLGQVAGVQLTPRGPPMIRTENAQLVNYIYVDMHERDIGGYVAEAQRAVARPGADPARLPPGVERAVRVPSSAPECDFRSSCRSPS